jgi:CBS-domain-containing membrane protein
MNSAIERLLTLRVSDIMNTPVTTVPESASMASAASTFAKFEITGAPVVDASGRCVGMLSTTDFALREHRMAAGEESMSGGWQHNIVQDGPDDPIHIEAIAEDRVSEHMSPAVQTIHDSASLVNAARVMCREHIHRLVIIDQNERPIGLISALDLVAAMVAAIEE